MPFIAHRGNDNHGFRENSCDAFIKCFNTDYIDGIELDVRLTVDNVVVVYHDNMASFSVINKTKFKKLKNVFSLDYILSFLSGNKKIIIDIKGDNSIIDFLYEVICKYDYNFYICGFNYDIVSSFKKKYPDYKVGLIIGYMLNIDKIYNNLDFNVLHYNLIRRVNKNKEVFIWTVNDKFIYNVIKKYGDFNIITDYSYLLK